MVKILKKKSRLIYAVFTAFTLAFFIIALTPNAIDVKAQTQDQVFIYVSVGGTISSAGTNLTGGTSYNYTNGQTISFSANPDPGCKFLFWSYASASGTNTSTNNPLQYTISSNECAVQAMFIPTTNASIASTSSQTGTAPFAVPISLGGTTTPAAGTYSNYTIGETVSFTANPGSGFKFLYWLVPAATGDAVSIVTSNTLAFNVTANACAIQAFFAPTSSNITVPSIPTVDEFSSVAIIILAVILATISLGTYKYSRTKQK